MLRRITVATITVLAMSASAIGIGAGAVAPTVVHAEEAVPTYYFWTDLYGHCPAYCNAQEYKCPCVSSEPEPLPPHGA